MTERFEPKSVLDVGCGSGIYLRILKSYNDCRILGLDGVEATSTVLDEDEFVNCDLEKPQELNSTYDLVLCLEVLEHMNPEGGLQTIETIEKAAGKRIVFSAAEPRQAGNGHIHCMPIEHWIDEWQSRGWRVNLTDTLALRLAANFSWFRRNLIVLDKGKTDDKQSAEFLVQVGQKSFRHPSQNKGIYPSAFMNSFPPPRGGYS